MSLAPIDGTDVSRWQGRIDWNAVATVPTIQVVAAQVGWKSEGRAAGILDIDPQYVNNAAGMSKLGLRWIVGHYLVPIGAAALSTQAEKAVAIMRGTVGWPLPFGHFFMLDIEYADLDKHGESALISWMFTLQRDLKRPVVWYGEKWARNAALADTPKVAADYSYGKDASTYEEALRQMRVRYTGIKNVCLHQWGGGDNGAVLPGISSGRVDSLAVLDAYQLARATGLDAWGVCDFAKAEA